MFVKLQQQLPSLRQLFICALCAVWLFTTPQTSLASDTDPVDDPFHLRRAADAAVSAGRYTEAKQLYTRALDILGNLDTTTTTSQDNKGKGEETVRILFKRAEVHRLRRSWSLAVADLNAILRHDPTHAAATLALTQTYLRQGNPSDSISTVDSFLSTVGDTHAKAKALRTVRDKALILQEAIRRGAEMLDAGNAAECVHTIDTAAREVRVDLSSKSGADGAVRYQRAVCACMSFDDVRHRAVCSTDTSFLVQRRSRDPSVIVLYARYGLFRMGRTKDAMAALRKCMQLDPDNKTCRKLLKSIRSADKYRREGINAANNGQHEHAVESLSEYVVLVRGDDGNDRKERILSGGDTGLVEGYSEAVHQLCVSLVHLATSPLEAVQRCTEAADVSVEENGSHRVQALLLRAEAKLSQDPVDLEGAKQDTMQAEQLLRGCQGCTSADQQRLGRVHRLIKRAGQKDYYKVLGIGKGSNAREVRKAYRKLARTYHPDVARDITREEAETKFQEIAEAYEVLSDEDLRRRYDNGEDINGGPQNEHHRGFHRQGSRTHFTFRSGGGPFEQFFRF